MDPKEEDTTKTTTDSENVSEDMWPNDEVSIGLEHDSHSTSSPKSNNNADTANIDPNAPVGITTALDTKLPQFYEHENSSKQHEKQHTKQEDTLSNHNHLHLNTPNLPVADLSADSDTELGSNMASFVSSSQDDSEQHIIQELDQSLNYGYRHSRQASLASSSSVASRTPGSGSGSNTPSIAGLLGGTSTSTTVPSNIAVYSIDHRLQTRHTKRYSSSGSSNLLNNNTEKIRSRHRNSMSAAPVGFDSLIDTNSLSTPWEAIRWSKLRKLSTQVYSSSSRETYGDPTVVLASSKICIGTSKGYVMVFDYHQTLEAVIGQKSLVENLGEVTSLATSVDQLYIGAGYSKGFIVTWDLRKPSHHNNTFAPITQVPETDMEPEGHMHGSSVIHLAFVGQRHSSLVSADTMGLVFIHDTFHTILSKTTKSKRILGRYLGVAPASLSSHSSNVVISTNVTKKRNAILAMEPRPLGVDVALGEDLFLLAIMTPHYLVIVSPFPHPQTQFKSVRHKEANVTMGFSACLSWYPGVKDTGQRKSTALLAYCWSNICKILEVRQYQDSNSNEYRLSFHSKKKFICDEPIVDIEWVNPKLLVLITITQRLLVLSEDTMSVSAVVDLTNKHPMHHDYFSASLSDLKLTLTTGIKEPAVVADSYANCIRVFKGKLFLLGNYEFVVGTLSAWADRLMDIMESGDYVRAIALATSFYLGEQDFVSLGLPKDDLERQEVLAKTLPDLLFACLNYSMKPAANNQDSDISTVREVVDSCLTAVCAMNRADLLDPIYEHFSSISVQKIFFDRLADFIYNGEISSLPPRVLKDMVLYLSGSLDDLEDVICRLDTSTLDLDLTLKLCESNNLVDSEIYIWNTAMHDYVTPLMKLIKIANKEIKENLGGSNSGGANKKATRLYPYLSYVFTGQVYPTGLMVEDAVDSYMAKCSLYQIILSGSLIHWDATYDDFSMRESRFPYLSLIIQYDCPAFFSAMNEAFEDSFLNDGEDKDVPPGVPSNDTAMFGKSVSRQLIVTTLFDVFHSEAFGPEMRVYFNIFLARNYPKFSQYIMLQGRQLTKIMEELCLQSYPSLKDECEIALQSLLSKFRPMNIDNLVSILYEQKYFSVLQYLFKSRQHYGKYLETSLGIYLESRSFADVSKLFSVVEECISATSGSLSKERSAVIELTALNFPKLVELDCETMVQIAERYCPSLHDRILKLDDGNQELQTRYLKEMFRLAMQSGKLPLMKFRTLYISFLAKRNENTEIKHLLDTFLTHEADVELPSVVDDLIENRCIDILVYLLCRQHRDSEAMIYLLDELHHLNEDLLSLSSRGNFAEDEVCAIEQDLEKFVDIGIDICQAAEKNGFKSESTNSSSALWTRLLDNLIIICNEEATMANSDSASDVTVNEYKEHIVQFKRGLLKKALSSLLNTTGSGAASLQHNKAVIDIFRSVLSSESKSFHTVGAVKPILDDVYAAYGYQCTMLMVTKGILEEDAYEVLLDLVSERLKGWRVSKTGECEGCGRKVVGVGVDADWLYKQWEQKQKQKTLLTFYPKANDNDKLDHSHREFSGSDSGSVEVGVEAGHADNLLVIFKCGHTFHYQCLGKLGVDSKDQIHCVLCESKN